MELFERALEAVNIISLVGLAIVWTSGYLFGRYNKRKLSGFLY